MNNSILEHCCPHEGCFQLLSVQLPREIMPVPEERPTAMQQSLGWSKQHAEAELWVFEAEALQEMWVKVGVVPSGNQHWIMAEVKGIESARNRNARHRGRYCMADGRKGIPQAEREKLI